MNVMQHGNVEIQIKDAGNEIVGKSINKGLFLARGSQISKDITIPSPNCWGINAPYLYTAIISLIVDGKIID